jgi:hypothetical protein
LEVTGKKSSAPIQGALRVLKSLAKLRQATAAISSAFFDHDFRLLDGINVNEAAI